MQDDQREQCIVQPLEVFPCFGFEFPQGAVGRKSEQSYHDHRGGKPGPVAQGKTSSQSATIGEEIIEHEGDLSAAMQRQSEDHVDDAEDSRPPPYVTAQIARYGIPSAQQEVGRPDEE